MPIPLIFQRYFSQATANPGDIITVVTKVYFTSPSSPNVNTWFTDIGDNLGGSDPTLGPLKNLTSSITTTNLFVSTGTTPGKAFLGHAGNTGCMRAWSNGAFPYPMGPNRALQNYWKPISPSTLSILQIDATYVVTDNASGSYLGYPFSLIAPSDTVLLPARIMATFGNNFTWQFDYSYPPGTSPILNIN